MIKKLHHRLLVLLAAISAAACTDYLDVLPEGTPELRDIFKTETQAEKFLATLYNYIPNVTGYRPMPDYCAGGDVMTGWVGAVRYFPYKSLLYNEESATTTYFGMWNVKGNPSGSQNYDLFKGIRYCYILLDNVDKVPGLNPKTRNQWIGEAKFLIAYYHWQLMSYYGPTVIVEREIGQNETDEAVIYPERRPYDECVTFVTRLLDEAAALMAATQPAGKLGRATSVAAKAIKARILLYAASPLVNGNSEFYAGFKDKSGRHLIAQEYDPEKWEKARTAAQEAIALAEENGYKLYENPTAAALPDAERGEINYHDLFVEPTWPQNPEYLWASGDQTYIRNVQFRGGARIEDPYNTSSFNPYVVPTFELVETYYSKNGLPMDADPETKGLDLYKMDPDKETALLHLNREPRFYASVGYDRGPYEINNQSFTLHCRKGERQGSTGNIAHEYQSCTGYVLKKWIHRTLAYDKGSQQYTYREYPFPLIRLAELYLSYAEADFEYTGSLGSQSLVYLNKVRKRAGLPDFEVSWNRAGGIPQGQKLRDVLHQERLIELAMEARWFHDIRRWKTAGKILGHTPKSWNLEASDGPGFYQVVNMKESGTRTFITPKSYWMAIPLSQININQNLVQNPGY